MRASLSQNSLRYNWTPEEVDERLRISVVELRRRFVGENEGGTVYDGPRKHGELPLSGRKFMGTKIRERLLAEDRILSSDWRNYDMEHVNYRPKGMTVEELERGYDELTRRFYSFGSMWRRLSLHRSLPAFGPMNFGFRSALRRKVADA